MQLDLIGVTIVAIEIIAVSILIIFVYPKKLRDNTLNLLKHGLSSSAATAINLGAVFLVMIPIFWKIASFDLVSSFQFPIMWTHAILGTATICLTLTMVALWLKHSLGDLGCAKASRLMKPSTILWIFTLAIGAFIKFSGLK